MILSFHPCFTGDINIIVAGRPPGADDLSKIKIADAVILPQGCQKALFKMVDDHCPNVFPDYRARFAYQGKTGQIKLFEKNRVPHPKSIIAPTVESFYDKYGLNPTGMGLNYPFVFKFNWGGEGHTVFLIKSSSDFIKILNSAKKYEKTNLSGFIIQEYIPSEGKTLRVVVIGKKYISYWRVQNDPDNFSTSLAAGAVLDFISEPQKQKAAIKAADDFCQMTGINLAGFDYIFNKKNEAEPLLIEINYFFGRSGLGGSKKYYPLLNDQIINWATKLGLSVKRLNKMDFS